MRANIPNLFLLGAAKAGTTTLYSILRRHPAVFMTSPKATRFFSKHHIYEKGLDWYLDTYFAGAEAYRVRGEATPSYLAQAEIVAPRIKAATPGLDAKLVAIFREPVERAYSHYWYNRNKKGEEDLSFEDALALEQKWAKDSVWPAGRSHTGAYFRNGQYARCVREYLRYFKRDQFLFLLFEDLAAEHFQATAARLMEFLDIEPIGIAPTRENVSRKIGARPLVRFKRTQRGLMRLLKSMLPKPWQQELRDRYDRTISQPVAYPPMKIETRRMLLDLYRSDIRELQDIIGRDLSHWPSA
jgi:hypothetical protein